MSKIFLSICLTLFITIGFAQDDKFSNIDIGIDYLSNTATFGQFSQFSKQPTFAPSVFFVHKSGFTASVIANYIGNSDTTLSQTTSEYDFVLGYFWQANKHLSIYPNYTRYYFPEDGLSLLSGYTDNFAMDVTYEWKIIQTGMNANYLIGDQNQWFTTLYLALSLSKDELFGGNNLIFFQPEISFNFGEQHYFTNTAITKFMNDSNYRDELLNDRQFRNQFNQLQQNTELSNTQILRLLLIEDTEAQESFNFNSLGVTLPVSLMFGNLSVNLGFSYYHLFNQPNYIDEKYQTYMNAGLAYTFYWE